jgi:hypothetical protein
VRQKFSRRQRPSPSIELPVELSHVAVEPSLGFVTPWLERSLPARSTCASIREGRGRFDGTDPVQDLEVVRVVLRQLEDRRHGPRRGGPHGPQRLDGEPAEDIVVVRQRGLQIGHQRRRVRAEFSDRDGRPNACLAARRPKAGADDLDHLAAVVPQPPDGEPHSRLRRRI